MNKVTLLRSILVISIAIFLFPLHAQKKGYAEGYIITWEGDTLQGWVKDRSPGYSAGLHSRIRFKPNDRWLRKKFGPEDIFGYGYNDLTFESLPLREESEFFRFRYVLDEGNRRVFLKVISRSEPLTYYHWEYTDGESDYVDYIPLFHKSYSSEMVRVTQGLLGLKRNRLQEYFRDCPELVSAIGNKEINEIMEVYSFYLSYCVDENMLFLYSDAGPEDDSQWKVTLEKDTMFWQGVGGEWANRFRIIHHRSD